jgi:hypothetical protein
MNESHDASGAFHAQPLIAINAEPASPAIQVIVLCLVIIFKISPSSVWLKLIQSIIQKRKVSNGIYVPFYPEGKSGTFVPAGTGSEA